MTRVTLAGALAVTLTLPVSMALLDGPGAATTVDTAARTTGIDLADENRDLWVATTAGLLRLTVADLGDEPDDGWDLAQLKASAGGFQEIGGRTDRQIDDVQHVTWDIGSESYDPGPNANADTDTAGNSETGTVGGNGEDEADQRDSVVVASEGALWAREADNVWVPICAAGDDTSGPPCPGRFTDLAAATVRAQPARTAADGGQCPEQPERMELLAAADDGVWRLRPNDPDDPRPLTEVTAWTWEPLDGAAGPAGSGRTPIRPMAVGQDRRGTLGGQSGRIWVAGEAADGAELRIYDPYPPADPSTCTPPPQPVVTRSLLGTAPFRGDSIMTPDTRGGMWLGLPGRVVWMDLDGAVRDSLDPCELRLGVHDDDGTCEPHEDPFSVMSIDDNLDDIWAAGLDGFVRLSVGTSSERIVSKLSDEGPTVDMARNRTGGDAWMASPDRLRRVEVDRWSWEPQDILDEARVTVLRSVGEKGAETVFIGTEQGLVVAGWDGDRSQLDGTVTVDGIAGPVQAISGATPDGTVFVAPESGLWAVRPDGTATPVPAMEGVRVGAVDVVADRLYAGTAEGARSAPVDSATTTRNFDAVRLVPADLGSGGTAPDAQSGPAPDVTAIWAFDGRPWFGTSNRGLMTVTGGEVDFCRTASTAGTSTDPSAVEADADRNPPPVGTVIRSGLATGGRAFVLATSEGVYDAQPVPSDGAGGCDLRFARRATSDANVAVEAGSFDNVATAPDGATSDDVAAQPVWSGADRSLDLIWWPGTNGPGGDADGGGDGDGDGDDSGGALGRVDGLVTSRFDGSTALDNSKVRALTTVGSGDGRTLLIGTDYGIWYHTPGRTDPRFRVDRIRALDESGNQVGEVVDCTETTATDDGTSCTDAEFDHRARTLEVELGIRSVGNPNGYQFVVTNAGGPPTLEQRRFTVPTDRGRTESLQLTALDEHLAQSRPLDVELRVRQRTPWQWFTETSAKWVAAVILTAAIALVVGYQVVRTVKRHGRRKLRDAEVAVQPATEDDSVTVTVGAATDRRMVDVEAVRKLWDQLRADKDPERILEIGDALHDGLLSPNAARELGRAGLGTHDLRLRLRGLDAELDALPWEALRTTSGSLVARQRTSIVRDLRPLSEEPGATPSAVESVAFPVRILVVVAQPGDMAPIAGVEEEIASIEKAAATRYRALLRTRFRARSLGTVEVLRRAGPASFRAAVSEGEGFDFVHVIAHGERTGRGSRIWLEDEDGDAVRMEADELVDLFAGHSKGRRRVRMVVLNTCSSADDGDAAPGEAAAGMAVALVQRAGLPAAVGMSMKIRTPAATTFCDAFYRTLFRHGQVDYAMYEARWKIGESDADWLAPRLYVGSAEAELYGDD